MDSITNMERRCVDAVNNLDIGSDPYIGEIVKAVLAEGRA